LEVTGDEVGHFADCIFIAFMHSNNPHFMFIAFVLFLVPCIACKTLSKRDDVVVLLEPDWLAGWRPFSV